MAEWALVTAVVVTGVFAAWRVAHAEMPRGGIVGADVTGITLEDAQGVEHALGDGRRTIVLVFNSQCGHCQREAPAWRAWLDANPDVRTVAVSTDPHSIATEFSTRYGWSTDVFTVDSPWYDGSSMSFMGRTPWIHVVSPTGVVEASMYGGELEALNTIITDHS